MKHIRQWAQVARPGVIVSTIIDADHLVETVTFTATGKARPMADVKVRRSDDPAVAEAMHALALAEAVAR